MHGVVFHQKNLLPYASEFKEKNTIFMMLCLIVYLNMLLKGQTKGLFDSWLTMTHFV
jgi:hypothetical protein